MPDCPFGVSTPITSAGDAADADRRAERIARRRTAPRAPSRRARSTGRPAVASPSAEGAAGGERRSRARRGRPSSVPVTVVRQLRVAVPPAGMPRRRRGDAGEARDLARDGGDVAAARRAASRAAGRAAARRRRARRSAGCSPSAEMSAGDLARGAAAEGDQRDHRGDADDDAEHGQDRAQSGCGGSRAAPSRAWSRASGVLPVARSLAVAEVDAARRRRRPCRPRG